MTNNLNKVTYVALMVLAIGVFVSVSLSAVSHILFIIPALYYFYQDEILKKNSLKYSWSTKFLLLLCLTIILSVLVNWSEYERPIKNLSKIKYFIIPVLSLYSLNHLLKDYLTKKRRNRLIYTLFFATTVATVSGLIAVKTGFNPIKMKAACHQTRACGLYGMYMTYGYGISLFSIIVTCLLLARQNFLKQWTVVVTAIISLLGTFYSFARGGWIGYLAGIGAFFFKKNTKKFLIFLSLVVISLGGALVSSDKVKNMFLNRSESNNQRIAFYQTAWVAFKERPILGWGYRNFEPNVKFLKERYSIKYPEFGGHAHNNLLEHLASTGILGFIFTLGFFISWLIEMYQRKDIIGLIGFPFVVNFLTSGLFQYTFGDGENLFLIMGFWAISQLRISADSSLCKE